MITVKGAGTLRAFTTAIESAFQKFPGHSLTLAQIHSSPYSIDDDLKILSESADIYLIHRPDELLQNIELREFFEANPQVKIILMGDLVMNDSFWNERKDFIKIIPHPFLDLTMPVKKSGKFIFGAYTTWGELRKFEHFISLAEEVKLLTDKIEFMVGGTNLPDVPNFMTVASDYFVPHFNVQLYHLEGKKRLGESSGSLHRGITVPVIFEANGIERVEKLKLIKVDADDDLEQIDFKKAAKEIVSMLGSVDEVLQFNQSLALKNTPDHFAKAILEF